MKVIAHRGASAEFPGNSMAAIDRALAIGADAIEVDLLVTKDRRLVACHDDLIRANGDWRYVRELTLRQLQRVDLGGGERVADLESVLARVRGRCELVLDLKSFGAAPLLADLLERNGNGAEFCVTSFLHPEIVEMGRLCPGIHRAVDLAAIPIDLGKILEDSGTRTVGMFRGYLNQAVVEKVHALGAQVLAYPVNLPREAALFETWGVAGIYTDDPAAMREPATA